VSRRATLLVGRIGELLDAEPNVTFTFTPSYGGAPFSKTQYVGPNQYWNFGTSWADFAGMGDNSLGTAVITAGTRVVSIVNTWDNWLTPDSLGTYNAVNY